MYKKFLTITLIILFLLIIIPSSFANTEEDSLSISSDIYFDANASDDKGDGSIQNPYKILRDGRILDNSVIHLAIGVYNYTQTDSHSNISFYGEDSSKTIINAHSSLSVDNQINLANITLNGLNIINQGNLKANNVIFKNSHSTSSNNYGGAIYSSNQNYALSIINCTFINNTADFGGAIYSNSADLTIINCTFINNSAFNYGGAVVCEGTSYRRSNVNIKNTVFINDTSTTDAGGGVFLKYTQFSGDDINITSSLAYFGSAFTLLNSNSKLSNINAYGNTALYDGGAIYVMYGNLTLTSSQITLNKAKNGAGLFIANTNYTLVENNLFKDNSADLYAGAVYAINSKIKNNNYINNSAEEYNDLYEVKNLNLTFYSNDYTLYYNLNTQTSLPSYYSSLAKGYVTPVKNQGDGGNCWAFSTIAALESAVLKASGETLILSEENMKNIASLYSNYGWSMDTNGGGYDDMALGYLVSWMGPVLEEDDEYSSKTILSPLLDSILHIQNIEFLRKTSNYNINSIKKAIMNYGAVVSGIFICASYNSRVNAYVQCYRGSYSCDHAVALVGWDDNFYIPDAPGRGAWICKNSWGSEWGNNGYFYVSYFDTSCPKLGEYEAAFAFILNDTIKYDKNYQYDIAKTDYFLNTSKTVWYKNIFTSTDNEYLAGVSTYFQKDTSWELSVNVNGVLKYKKSGTSPSGYYTIPLDEMIALKTGDKFEVVFKITVDSNAGVPISEIVSLNNYFYTENISYISYDGKKWRDLYNLKWDYPDHTYSSQVACIKAFTIINSINNTIELSDIYRNENDIEFSVKVLNQYGHFVKDGNITLEIDNKTFNYKLQNYELKLNLNLTSSDITIYFTSSGFVKTNKTFKLRNPLINTNITLNLTNSNNPLNITAYVVDEDLNPVKSGEVIFNFNNKLYIADVNEGFANIVVNSTRDVAVIYAFYEDSFYYNSSFTFKTVEIEYTDTVISLNIASNEYNNPVLIKAVIKDLNGRYVNSGKVRFSLDDETYYADVLNGIAFINHTFSRSGLFTVNATYFDDFIYNFALDSIDVDVSLIKVNLTFDSLISENEAVLGVSIKNATKGFEILLNLNNKTYNYKSAENYVIMDLKDLDEGEYNYTISLISSVYESANITGTFNITYIKTQITASNTTLYYGGKYSAVLKDKYGNILADKDVYITVNQKTYKNRTNADGVCVFYLDAGIGEFTSKISFIGDDDYIQSYVNVNITIKSTVDTFNQKYTLNSKYKVVLKDSEGRLLVNKKVSITLNRVTYDLKTDSKGVAQININLMPSIYYVQIRNYETNEYKIHFIQVYKRISENKGFKMYYGADKYYKVRVLDDNGKYSSGLKVKFTVNGKKYYALTDKNGYASFKINLKPSTYTIIAEYKGFSVTNNIVVKSTLITKNIKVKSKKPIKFQAKLVDSKGKILKHKKVTFKFKSKIYKIKTNAKGIATLKLNKNYNVGKYRIITKYNDLSVKNTISIKK